MHRLSVSAVIFIGMFSGMLPLASVAGDEYSPGQRIASWLDQQLESEWAESQKCDDLTFARRVYLDVLGRIPSVPETRDYMAVEETARRNWLVEKLLYPTDQYSDQTLQTSAQHWARIWRRILLPPAQMEAPAAMQVEGWLVTQFSEDVPFDQVSRQLVTPADSPGGRALYTAAGGSPQSYVTQVARGLLGVRIHCAQCHDHPFTNWKQEDFWGMAAYYSGG
ncbi:MAG: DUF1549 domain-containing protein, partial [Pirellulales bacterium]|nr:DUF1549 domain-containing protein [Pirellulales bacterium]